MDTSPRTLLVNMQTGAATVEISEEFPHKIRNETALWPSDFIFQKIPKENPNTDLKEHKHSYVHCSIIYSRQ